MNLAAEAWPGPRATPGIGFIGAGSFAQKFLIPFARKGGDLLPWSPRAGSRQRAWARSSASLRTRPTPGTSWRILRSTRCSLPPGTTRMPPLRSAALEAGKNVFVEKPLAIREDELAQVLEVASRRSDCHLMVGYNRRFSPLARRAREVFAARRRPAAHQLSGQRRIPAERALDPDGTGRRPHTGRGVPLRGPDAVPHRLQSGHCLRSERCRRQCPDARSGQCRRSRCVSEMGRWARSVYLACGDKSLSKERIEIFGGGQTFVIDDFRDGEHSRGATAAS